MISETCLHGTGHFARCALRGCNCICHRPDAHTVRQNTIAKVARTVGQEVQFSRLTVVQVSAKTRRGRILLDCICTCGKIVQADLWNLESGRVMSCGCLHREMASARMPKIRLAPGRHWMCGSREYASWQAMKSRCYRKTNVNYKWYGAKGVTVCARWNDSFDNFFADMGNRPAATSIDRINPAGDYEPENCKWSTQVDQIRNRRQKTAVA